LIRLPLQFVCSLSPGVDENGSGVAALLAATKVLGHKNKDGATRNNTVLFLAFDLGEQGW